MNRSHLEMKSSNYSYLVKDLWDAFGWRCLLLVALIIANGFLEGMALILLYPLLGQLGIGGSNSSGSLAVFFNNFFVKTGLSKNLITVSVLIITAFALQYSVYLIQSFFAARIQNGYVKTRRNRLFDVLLHANWQFFVNHRAGELANSVISETVRAGGALYLIIQLIAMGLVTSIYIGIAFLASWQMTLVLVLVAGLILLGTHGLVRHGKNIGEEISRHSADFMGWTNEVLNGMKLVKATAAEKYINNRFRWIVEELRRLYFWTSFHPHLLRAVFEFVAIVALVSMLVVSVEFLALDTATLLVVIALFVRLYPRASVLQQNLQLLNTHFPAVERIRELETLAIDAWEVPIEAESPVYSAKDSPIGIAIENLNVQYADKSVLKEVSIEIRAGKTTAIVGPSGAGKTTLLDCMLKLIDPRSGRILINGVSLPELSLSGWRKAIGYVSQETILFNTSFRENIAWSNLQAEETEVIEAAKKAHAHGFILETSNGYDTLVGDRGVRLSGGQRQRIGLARALVGNKVLLILDEATSALDSESEAVVMEAIRELHGQITIVIVAHRLSTIRHADRIYVLENGRVVENGTWAELITSGARFNTLWQMQSTEP